MADVVNTTDKKVSKTEIVGTVKQFLPTDRKQIAGTTAISTVVGILTFIIGRLTKSKKVKNEGKK